MKKLVDYSNYDPSHMKFSLENKAKLLKLKNILVFKINELSLWVFRQNTKT
jgi:hypothetical protein